MAEDAELVFILRVITEDEEEMTVDPGKEAAGIRRGDELCLPTLLLG
jgi:hypothetical protein